MNIGFNQNYEIKRKHLHCSQNAEQPLDKHWIACTSWNHYMNANTTFQTVTIINTVRNSFQTYL